MIVILTGIPGAGKTTVATQALKELEEENIKYELITYGDVMFDMAENLGLVENRDEMRKLDAEEQKKIQRLAGSKIAQMAEEQNIIVDTHCTINTPHGFLPGLPEWVLRELNPDVYVLIEADAVEIAGRRSKDTSRDRDKESSDEIALHQQINRSIATAYSIFSGGTVKIVENPEGKIDEAVKSLKIVLS